MKRLSLLLILSLTFFGCTKDHPDPATTIDAPELELKYDKEHQFILREGAANVPASDFTWTSSNDKVGKVDANGLFKARKIGKTTITALPKSGGLAVSSEITVSPYQTFIDEPIMDFTATKETIKSMEKRVLINEQEEYLFYDDGGPDVKSRIYVFRNGRLWGVSVVYDFGRTNELAQQFYDERYPDMGDRHDIYMETGLSPYRIVLDDERKYAVILYGSHQLGPNAWYTAYKPK